MIFSQHRTASSQSRLFIASSEEAITSESESWFDMVRLTL